MNSSVPYRTCIHSGGGASLGTPGYPETIEDGSHIRPLLWFSLRCHEPVRDACALLTLLTISQKQMFAFSDLLLVREANAPGSQIHEWLVTKAFIFLRQLLTV